MIKRIHDLVDRYPKFVSAFTYILIGVGGFAASEAKNILLDHRTTEREILKVQVEKSIEAEVQLATILRKFADRATGRGQTSPEDIKALREQAWKIHLAAQNVATQVPAVKPEFEAYAVALVRLQKSAERLTGPLDGKPFVESVSAYLSAQQKFTAKVLEARTDWWL